MKKMVWLLAVLCAAGLICSGCNKAEDASSAASSSTVSSAISQEASSGQNSSAVSGQESSSANSQGGSVSQGEMVKTESTDSEAFNAKFKQNPIDAKYIPEMKKAMSNTAMAAVSSKYAGIWEKEINHALSELEDQLDSDSDKKAKVEEEQKEWEAGRAAALKKISDDAQTLGGSMARVEAASKGMDFYRSRAAALYRELYDCEPDYTYAFS